MLKSLFAATTVALAAQATAAEPFTFVAFGDAPYGDPVKVYPAFEVLLDTINAQDPALVIHVGDTKSGNTPCSDKTLTDQLNFMDRLVAPVLYTPGDNEWTDCHRRKAGGFDPEERLAFIRTTYFADPSQSFGQTKLPVDHQGAAGYPENARMMLNGVMFATAHVVGSNNNFEVRDQSATLEFFARDMSNINWLNETFAEAQDADALVLAIHANIFRFDFNEAGNAEGWLRHSGFQNFGEALKTEAARFGKPVLLVYGDSHQYRQSNPFPATAPNLLALEVPGAKDMHAVKITANTQNAGMFSISLLRNPAVSN